jgi:hypothetical protein
MKKTSAVKYNLTALDTFVKAFGNKGWVVKVGILGNKNGRKEGPTNSDIGAAHEFGSYSKHIPQRSFLRMPLHTKTNDILKLVGKQALYHLLHEDKKALLVDLGIACEQIIGEAFDTQGFGKWAPLEPTTIKSKIGQNPNPLVNTSQLRRSITSKVEHKS